ncbi:hypothetical protein [Shewanella dokdonensis]|uniref:Uncharacterized protein n=1 Tax=Shewanella dokdonensis TaxID=712036 RepID=A0ABX8DD59_9GAMM|nr:hypothetical protein [Shewanella dokdonensis]MCL1073548.1 hypothetical protein [Shewanella dokdonensis]QVK22682.1 hypothetical protein KHX94_15625 [Shewanella dokdonensis]
MFKASLANLRGSKQTVLEREIAKEQSTALGKAGRRLKATLDAYQTDSACQFRRHTEAWHIQQLTDAVYALMVTREFLGFVDCNLEWICQQYPLPQAVLENLAPAKQLEYLQQEWHYR